MREPFGRRVIAAMEEVLADVKKVKEGMQESGDDKFVNEKKLQTKVNPMGIRNDKEPADVPLDIDELSYSKKGKQKFLQVPPNQPAVYDANTAENKMAKEKKHDMNRIEQIHNAWKEVKAKKEQDKHDMNCVEKIKVSRADDEEKEKKDKKSDSYFGNFDGHDGHSYSGSKPNIKVKKDKSDYEGGNF